MLYQKAKSGRVNQIEIVADDNKIITEWFSSKDGKPGKIQRAEETVVGVNKGKANETSDSEQCILEFDRKVKEKIDEGYLESLEDALAKKNVVDITQRLPKSFAPCKPLKTMPKGSDPKDKKYLAERKFNGECLIMHNTGEETIVYSRRINEITHVVGCVDDVRKKLTKLPAKSLVVGELVAYDSDGKEDTSVLKSVTADKSTTEKASAKYAEYVSEGYVFEYRVYDIYFYLGEDVTSKTFKERLAIEESIFGKRDLFSLTDDIIKKASEDGWEGFILRTEDSTICFTLNGDPERTGSYKYKFIETEDCIVKIIDRGYKGKYETKFARFNLYQYDGDRLVDCGWAGTGKLTKKTIAEFTDEFVGKGYEIGVAELKKEDWLVAEIRHFGRHPVNPDGQHCFIMAQLVRFRDDKPLAECKYETE
jgi:ATP-dependent DNA ligase